MSFTSLPCISLADMAVGDNDEAVVLTVNNRLARRLVSELGTALRDAGISAAVAPAVLPFSAWADNLAEQASFDPDGGLPLHRLDSFAARLLWRNAIRQDADASLLDPYEAAKLSAEAEHLIQEWHIQAPDDANEEYAQFVRWRARYRQLLAECGADDTDTRMNLLLAQLRIGMLRIPRAIVLAGMRELSPRQQALLDALVARGSEVYRLAEDEMAPAKAQRFAADDLLSEWQAAAAWAARQLDKSTGRFAIVAADLQDNAPFARRVLQSALGGQAFNVSVGRPLDEWPLVNAALAWLTLLAQPGPYAPADLARALLGGHCVGHGSEAMARAQLDAQWRYQQTLTLSGSAWQRALDACPMLQQAWKVAVPAFRHGSHSRHGTSADWALRMRTGLAELGFPGDVPLDSTGYQVFEAFQELLLHFAALAPATGELSAAEAVALLVQLARETPFQPERAANARLDVLGLLEAEGERWDGVWILGMTDDVLPAPPSPNPLLPASALAEANAPRATAARELAYAHDLFDALLHCAPAVIVSHALLNGDQELRPSPLIASLPLLAALPGTALDERAAALGDAQQGDLFSSDPGTGLLTDTAVEIDFAADAGNNPFPAAHVHDRVVLEPLHHDPGPPLPPGTTLSGGTAILDTQARNPLWAFVRYRLGARMLPGHAQQLALSLLRGNFLHLAMQTLWESLRSSRALAQAVANDTLMPLLDQALESAARRELRTFSPALRELECQRARNVLTQWLTVEAQRLPFEIAFIEGKQRWRRGPLQLTLRLDRVDRLLGTGSLVILDYKSGMHLDINGWARERPVSLQLPFYAAVLYQGHDEDGYAVPLCTASLGPTPPVHAPRVAALALAALNARHVSTLGVAGEATGLPGVLDLGADAPDDRRRRPSAFEQASWPAWLAHWQRSIESLADEFIAGRADNVTTRPSDLQYCDVLPFLRSELEIDIDEAMP